MKNSASWKIASYHFVSSRAPLISKYSEPSLSFNNTAHSDCRGRTKSHGVSPCYLQWVLISLKIIHVFKLLWKEYQHDVHTGTLLFFLYSLELQYILNTVIFKYWTNWNRIYSMCIWKKLDTKYKGLAQTCTKKKKLEKQNITTALTFLVPAP